jgi:hypothetical protein
MRPGLVIMDYELANYLLATLPPDEREQTVASLRRANAAEFRRMREAVVWASLRDKDSAETAVTERARASTGQGTTSVAALL